MKYRDKTKVELIEELQKLHQEYDSLKTSYEKDITGRKRAEENLHESAMKLARSQKIGKLGSWEWNIVENSLEWSDELYRIWGVGKDFSLTYESINQMIHPDDREINLKMIQEFLTNNKNGEFEFRIICPDGTIKNIYQSIEMSRASSGQPLRMFGIMQDITHRKLAEEENKKSRELLEDLYKHLEDIRENERALISREIHDQIGQSLTALKLDLNWLKKPLKNANPETAAKLQGMIDLVSNTIKDVQRISSDLRPGILDDIGLTAAIEWYSGEFTERTRIRCNLELDDSVPGDPPKNLVFFRVLQEALTNVIRHANASTVTIKLRHTRKGTTLTIQDDGIGITRENVESGKSLGLIGMRERIKQFEGKLDISSGTGQGTKLIIFIPE